MTESQTPPEVIAGWLMGLSVDPISLPEPYRAVLRKAVDMRRSTTGSGQQPSMPR